MSDAREGRALALAALLCGVFLLAPLWVGGILPLLDLPQHLAVVSVLRHHGDAEWGFAPFFERQWLELTPYWTYYLATLALSLAMPVEVASRVVLSLYALAFPWAGVALARAFGRSPWLGLLAAPLALNTNVYYGFVSYCLAVLFLLVLLAAFERYLEVATARRWVGLALGAAVLFFTHVQVFALFVAGALVVALFRAGTAWRRRVTAALALAPATLMLFLPWIWTQFIGAREGVRDRYTFGRVGRLGATTRSPGEALLELPRAIGGSFQDGSDLWLGLAALALLVLAFRGPNPRLRALGPAVLASVAYVVAPVSIAGQWNIGPRFAWPAALLLLPVLPAAGRWARALGWSAVVLTAAVGLNAALHHAAFDREAEPLGRAVDAIPRGGRVLPLIYENRGQVVEAWPYLHVGQYAMVRRGGVATPNLGRIPAFPIRQRDREGLPALDPFRPQAFRFAETGPAYDCFLVRGTPPVGTFPDGAVETLFQGGAWMVLRRR